jgi:hypothetical protein
LTAACKGAGGISRAAGPPILTTLSKKALSPPRRAP